MGKGGPGLLDTPRSRLNPLESLRRGGEAGVAETRRRREASGEGKPKQLRRDAEIENLNRRDPIPGSRAADPGIFFRNTVYPPEIRGRQITRTFAAKGALRQYDG